MTTKHHLERHSLSFRETIFPCSRILIVPTNMGKMGRTYMSILGLLHVAISKLLINLIAVNGQFNNWIRITLDTSANPGEVMVFTERAKPEPIITGITKKQQQNPIETWEKDHRIKFSQQKSLGILKESVQHSLLFCLKRPNLPSMQVSSLIVWSAGGASLTCAIMPWTNSAWLPGKIPMCSPGR